MTTANHRAAVGALPAAGGPGAPDETAAATGSPLPRQPGQGQPPAAPDRTRVPRRRPDGAPRQNNRTDRHPALGPPPATAGDRIGSAISRTDNSAPPSDRGASAQDVLLNGNRPAGTAPAAPATPEPAAQPAMATGPCGNAVAGLPGQAGTASAPSVPARPGAGHRLRAALGRHAVDAARVARRAAANAWRDRVLGLAAEAGFWQLLSLPPLLLALLGTIGYFADAVGSDVVDNVRDTLLRGAADLLTDNVVADVATPTINQILSRGRPDVISIGFVMSLWTGSTAMATFVNTITIAYGQRDLRDAVRSRLLALRLFVAQILTGVVILPALVLGPGMVANVLRAGRHHSVELALRLAFWPVVAALALTMLTALYHLSLPRRRPWRRAIPGAVFAVVGWLLGAFLLRLYIERVFGNELVYGSLAAPAAALLFFYITALAVLLGAELNAALDQRGVPVPDDSDQDTPAPAPGKQSAPGAGAQPALPE